MSKTTCGEATHDEECLCDVVVVSPAPLVFHPVETTFGPMVARAVGWKPTHGPTRTLEFMEALLTANDAALRRRSLPADSVERLRGANRPDHPARALIAKALSEGYSMPQLPALLGFPLMELAMTVTGLSPSRLWLWGEADWISFECSMATTPSPNQLAAKFGLNVQTAANLMRLYGHEPATPAPTLRRRAVANAMKANPGLTVDEAVEVLRSLGGKVPERNKVARMMDGLRRKLSAQA